MTPRWALIWIQAIRGSSFSTLVFECMFCLPLLYEEPLQGCSLEKAMWCWDHPDGVHEWTQFKVFIYTFKFLVCQGGWKFHLVTTQDKSHFKFPCLLNLASTYLLWSASFFDLSLPSVYEGQFQIFIWEAPEFANQQAMYLIYLSLLPAWRCFI